ncbi:MAG: DUF1631 family protein [Pseudomonadales bacterium]|nr:DUF1631 family protein [Pseudomonadales bacterium]
MRTMSEGHSHALVARPLPAPEEFDATLRRRWALFAPALAACLRETLNRATDLLFEEADQAQANDRRRLAFDSARELAALARRLGQRDRDALVRLFVEPAELAACWQAETGAFALGQSAERLLRAHGDALVALHRRLHGHACANGRPMADQLAGLLAATVGAEALSAHGRNVLCATWCRRLEGVLPGLAGASRSSSGTAALGAPPRLVAERATKEGGPRRVVPRPVLDALTRAQLQGLEGATDADLRATVASSLATSRTPFDPAEADRALRMIREESDALALLRRDDRLPRATAQALGAVAPVLARAHCEYAPPHAAALGFLEVVVGATLDLGETARDPRHQLLEDVSGDVLARFRGDVADLEELTEEAREQLVPLLERQLELRRRTRERALADRRRLQARNAADAVCAHLSARSELVPFLDQAWRGALVQAHLRYGQDSVPWRRMLVIGQTLLTARRMDLPELRPSIADALSLALPDAVEVEARVDSLYVALRKPGVEVQESIQATLPAVRASDRVHADALPWLLADGRRRWLLVQGQDGAGEVLLCDALGREVEWMDAAAFDAAVDAGEARPLVPKEVLGPYASR